MMSIPLLVLAFTGWIPDQYGPQGSWPWSAMVGFSLIAVAILGLFRPVVETLRSEVGKSRPRGDTVMTMSAPGSE